MARGVLLFSVCVYECACECVAVSGHRYQHNNLAEAEVGADRKNQKRDSQFDCNSHGRAA